MVFDEPFWSDATHTHMLFISDHAPFELPLWLDLNEIERATRPGRDRPAAAARGSCTRSSPTSGWRSRSPA